MMRIKLNLCRSRVEAFLIIVFYVFFQSSAREGSDCVIQCLGYKNLWNFHVKRVTFKFKKSDKALTKELYSVLSHFNLF